MADLPVPSPVKVPSDVLSSSGRAAQDLALGALLGANLFGRVAMHPALADISDERQRGQVLNHAWRRYGTVNSLALATLVAGWLPARVNETRPLWLSRRERSFALLKDVSLAATVVTGLATGLGGIGFARQAPEGAVALQDGDHASTDTPPRATRLKRLTRVLGTAHLGALVMLVTSNAFLAQQGFRRPPLRRVLRRRY